MNIDDTIKANPTKEDMLKQLHLDAALMDCVRTLYFSDDVNAAINEILKIIAEFHNADRAYIFEFDKNQPVINNTYEFCREGVEPQIDVLQEVDIHVIDRWMVQFETKGEFYLNSLDAETEKGSDEYEILATQNIDSLIAAPLKINEEIVGFLGVDNPHDNTDTLFLMQSAAAFVVNDIEKRVSLEQKMVNAISGIYRSMHLINIPENTQIEFQSNFGIRQYMNNFENADKQMIAAMKMLTDKEYTETMLEFTDFATINDRLKDLNVISQEYLTNDNHWCRANFIPMTRDDDGNIIEVIFAVRSIDKEKQKELEYQRELKKALENQNEVYTEILNMQSYGLIAVNVDDGSTLMVNDVVRNMFDCDKEDSEIDIDKDFVAKIISSKTKEMFEHIRATKKPGENYICEYMLQKGNKYLYVMSQSKVVVLKNGMVVRISSLVDITDKKKQEQQLIVLSQTDALTGINNRGNGETEIENMLKENVHGMFCLFDVDKFKFVNDDYGHIVGDKVLIEIANCLKESFSDRDIIMRLGGDEFAAYAVGIEKQEEGEKLIKKFLERVDDINIPELVDRKVTISLGAVMYSGGSDDFDELYQKADFVMYICKNTKGESYKFYK